MAEVATKCADTQSAISKLWTEVYTEALRHGDPAPIASADADHAVATLDTILKVKREGPEPV